MFINSEVASGRFRGRRQVTVGPVCRLPSRHSRRRRQSMDNDIAIRTQRRRPPTGDGDCRVRPRGRVGATCVIAGRRTDGRGQHRRRRWIDQKDMTVT